MEQCKYCFNMFGDKKMLGRHQKNTQYCLKIQQSKAKEDADAKAKALVEAKENERKEFETKERKEADELILKEKASELTCQFCNKQFKTKYLLNIHQTQTKYCLKIQESQNSEAIIRSFITCKFCNKNFASSIFNRHDSTCKKKNQFILNQKEEEIAKLKMKAEKDQEIAMKDEEITRMKIKKKKLV